MPALIDARALWTLLFGAACALGGAYAGYQLRESEQITEKLVSAPESRQTDGSLVLASEPTATPIPPPHDLGGQQETRRVSVTVAPRAVAAAPDQRGDCPPVTVDLSLVRDGAGQTRVIASSPHGVVTGGLDAPITPTVSIRQTLWAAGVGYDLQSEAVGIRVDRDFRHNVAWLPNRVSADAMLGDYNRDGSRSEAAVRVWALWRFGG